MTAKPPPFRNSKLKTQSPTTSEFAKLAKLNVPVSSRLLPEVDGGENLAVLLQALTDSGTPTLEPYLPLLFRLHGKPLTLERHFPFRPFFRTRMASHTLLKCGRQMGKSSAQAERGLAVAAAVPNFTQLYVTPLFEQIRRLSNNYVRPLMFNSPVRGLFSGPNADNNVLQRALPNESMLMFSFGFLDVERVRGIAAGALSIDELQGMDKDFLPILAETLSGSEDWGITMYSGTPKSMDNTVESVWADSSQGEFCIKCFACNHWNVPALTHDLDKMIGPYHEDISEEKPGVVCAKCSRPVYPHLPGHARWVHADPTRRWTMAGYHMPQIVMPLHYGNPDKWRTLVAKREGAWQTTTAAFYNEVCAESYDIGAKIVTQTELRSAACLHENSIEQAKKTINNYQYRVLAADWGGYGQQQTSFTAIAVLGIKRDGTIDVIYGHRFLIPHAKHEEAKLILKIMAELKCNALAHDFSGAGSSTEDFIINAGLPLERIFPIKIVRATAAPVWRFKPVNKTVHRAHYVMDKTRSLLMTCHLIKSRDLKFFAWDDKGEHDRGLISDFLSLVEEKLDGRVGADVYLITRQPGRPDDFAQAVNLGVCSLFAMTDRWPQFAEREDVRISPSMEASLDPDDEVLEDLAWGGGEFEY